MIRLATEEDEDQLQEICYKFFQKTNHNDLTYSRQKVTTLIRCFTGGDINQYICLVAEDELGTIFSVLGGFTTSHIFADNKVAYELIWYVDPLYQRRKDVILIVKAYEAWARKVGCTHCVMGSTTQSAALDRYYKKNKYIPLETVYKKKL